LAETALESLIDPLGIPLGRQAPGDLGAVEFDLRDESAGDGPSLDLIREREGSPI
jgi:hypothetical protein